MLNEKWPCDTILPIHRHHVAQRKRCLITRSGGRLYDGPPATRILSVRLAHPNAIAITKTFCCRIQKLSPASRTRFKMSPRLLDSLKRHNTLRLPAARATHRKLQKMPKFNQPGGPSQNGRSPTRWVGRAGETQARKNACRNSLDWLSELERLNAGVPPSGQSARRRGATQWRAPERLRIDL